MFAAGTEIRTSDLHSIISLQDNSWLNPPKNVLLEPHVWLGNGALVLKGVRIGFGSIIGARSVVTRDIARFSIAAGMPAQILKNDVSWDSQVEPRPGLMSALRESCAKLLHE